MTSRTTRRAILAGAATVPALSLPAVGAESDPIYAVIAEHEAAYRIEVEIDAREGQLRELDGDPDTHINAYLSPEDIVETDSPQWKELVRELIASNRRYHAAQWALADTPPTTLAGLQALLTYLAKHQEREAKRFGCAYMAWPERRIGATPDEDSDEDMWAPRLFETLAKAAQS